MTSSYEEVNQANSLIEDADLPHPSGALLLSFIAEALDPRRAANYVLETCHNSNTDTRTRLLALVDDWIYIVDQVSKRGSAPPTPNASERRQIIARDGTRCCITGKPARLWDPLVVDFILPVPSGWTAAQDDRPRLPSVLAAFFGPGYRDWWLNYAINPDQFTSPLLNHWLVSKSASLAFRRGHVMLQRRQPSMIEYEVHQVSIGPDQPLPLDGDKPLLGDHSRTGILTVDARFIGTHSRLAKSIQLIELASKFSSSSSIEPLRRDHLQSRRSWDFSQPRYSLPRSSQPGFSSQHKSVYWATEHSERLLENFTNRKPVPCRNFPLVSTSSPQAATSTTPCSRSESTPPSPCPNPSTTSHIHPRTRAISS